MTARFCFDRFWSGNICDRLFFEPDRFRASRALFLKEMTGDKDGHVRQNPALNLDRVFFFVSMERDEGV